MTVETAPRVARGVPDRAGVGLKGAHAAAILGGGGVAWVEVHAENYMVEGGPRLAFLEAVRRDHPLSIHGVALSLAAPAPPDGDHLARLKALVDRFEPGLVSEHVAWSDHGGVHFADLLPVPRGRRELVQLCDNIDAVQTALGRRILIENPTAYAPLPGDEMGEIAFLLEAARRTGCGLLVDVNNVFVGAANVGHDPAAWIDAVPGDLVGEIHLAGHSPDPAADGPPLLIDTHAAPVADPVWDLFARLVRRIGPRPALIERDGDVPPWEVLAAEAVRADRVLEAARMPAEAAA